MTSSRSSSPATDSSPSSPSQLTPRSKVKALLAAVDDESDTENSPASMRSKPGNKLDLLSRSNKDQIEKQFVSDIETNNETRNDEESEDDEVIFKPRGRLAARMHAVRAVGGEDDDNEAKSARDRVRKLLMPATKKSPQAGDGNKNDSGKGSENSSPVSRKRKLERPLASTPESSLPAPDQTSSEGLFVSPSSPHLSGLVHDDSGSDDGLPSNPNANARFLALVQKKREERLAREVENERQKNKKAAERARLAKDHSAILEDDIVDFSDDDGGRQLTQQARPTRKASKKALEEMHRETQRMSRNMQLAHEARTKKKITKSSLFAKFNYKPAGFEKLDSIEDVRPTSSSSPAFTDSETKDTPPTSPISHDGEKSKTVDAQMYHMDLDVGNAHILDNSKDGEMSSIEDISKIVISPPHLATKTDKGKERALEGASSPPKEDSTLQKRTKSDLRPLRIRPSRNVMKSVSTGEDSDSDLEIITVQTPKQKAGDSIFDRFPAKQAKESHSLHALRMLAHITSPGKQLRERGSKPSMTAVELQNNLQQRARQQAAREREERLQALRASGVLVQTTEEREKEIAEMEDLMAMARREADEIMKREKESAKRERKANGELEPTEDSDDDEEWEEEKEKFADQMSASGSESEEEDGDASGEEELDDDEDAISVDEDEDEAEPAAQEPADLLLDNEASESDLSENSHIFDPEDEADLTDDREESLDGAHDKDAVPRLKACRKAKRLVVSDDEDNEVVVPQSPAMPCTESPIARTAESPMAPPSVLRSATKTFIPGLTVAGPAGLGLTQIFAGTMDDIQSQSFNDAQIIQSQPVQGLDSAQDSLAFLRNLPTPELPLFEPTINDDQEIIRDSQTQISQIPQSPLTSALSQDIQLHFSQSQIHGFDSMLQDPTATQYSEFPDPTQDAGFQTMSPIKGRFVELAPSTIDTVIVEQPQLSDRVSESPVAKRKGKLRRKADLLDMPTNEEDEAPRILPMEMNEFDISESVFDVMRKASKRKEAPIDEFDKKKSAAKEMVEEQAEESEDEYAGLGGASDDESGGEDDALAREMIDDDGGKDADESKIAAFYADKERKSDEKQVEKLFNDITKGMLRRKRGADYDLSDSDDGGEARRRMKRKEFAKMRKALLEDERIGKIAENPKKLAFLRAIEDRNEEEEIDFLDDLAEPEEAANSQTQSQMEQSRRETKTAYDNHGDEVMGPPKRKLSDDVEPSNRLPPHLRRTKPAKRPSNLSEIRQSLSSLIEDPNSIIETHHVLGSDSEAEDSINDTDGLKLKEKENRDPFASRRKTSTTVVDRISLKRMSSNAASSSARLAFAAPSSAPGFKIPALLRRTTTNTSTVSGSSTSSISGTERTAGGFADDGKFTKKAGKNSGVHYFARENERRMKVEENEKRRKEKRFKGAEGRRKVVKGLFGMGTFE